MVLVGGGIVVSLLALAALIPRDRLPGWLRVYIGVAVACGILVVLVAMFA